MSRVRARHWLTGLIVAVGIGTSIQACGEGGNREWIVAWNTSWTGPESVKPVSRDGRYAYFVTEKFIDPTLGRWDRRWRSAPFRGRVDLVTGKVDTGPLPAGMRLIGIAGYQLADSVILQLKSDRVPFYFTGSDVRHHGYGDGRFLLLLTRHNAQALTAFLLDNEDTFRVIGPGFRDGWVSTDEKSVVLVNDTGDTWIYEVETRKLRRLGTSESPPRFLRGLKDLPVEAQQIASAAMGRHCTQRRFHFIYPEQEELR